MTVYFIGAGPGAPDLITVRGLRLIERCPVCLYAGSLVPEEIVHAAPADALVRDTAPMHLDEIYAALESCNLFMAVGTSGQVYPAAGFVLHVRRRPRVRAVELNLEPSEVGSHRRRPTPRCHDRL